jgi:predicted ATP-grasp superfamily ATP-dependent carboligase
MLVGAFELVEPLPELREPTLLLALQPWIDVGSVGSMALTYLEEAWGARPLGHLARPGRFYDFTRYRPTLYRRGRHREISVPNTYLRYVQGQGDTDWLLVHALEPHSHGEDFVDSLVKVMQELGVRQYCLIGSYYAPIPHTRPLLLTGMAASDSATARLRAVGVRESQYEGPTTIVALTTEEARLRGIDAMSALVQLPAYAQLERDYRGLYTLLTCLSSLFGFSLDLERLRLEGERQYATLDDQVKRDPRLHSWVEELERIYDAEVSSGAPDETPRLSPELERFLEEIERRWEGPQGPGPDA